MDKYLNCSPHRLGGSSIFKFRYTTSRTEDMRQTKNSALINSPILVLKYDNAHHAEAVEFIRHYDSTPLVIVSDKFTADTVLWAVHEQVVELIRLPAEQDYLDQLISSVGNNIYAQDTDKEPTGLVNDFPVILSISKSNQINKTNPIKHSLEYIHHNFREKILIQDLAKLSNMSLSTLKRHFKKSVQISSNDYMKMLRFHVSKQLLRHTQLQIGEIAHMTGYCDTSHFGRIFKNVFGESPSEYRIRISLCEHHRPTTLIST